MHKRHYLDPLGTRLPAFERAMLKLRALQMVLAMFYAEELKRKVLDTIQITDNVKSAIWTDLSQNKRVPKGTKNAVDKALSALVADNAIVISDKEEINSLIDYRNTIAHRIHELVGDLSNIGYVREFYDRAPDKVKKFDYKAVDRLRYFIKKIDSLYKTHHYITTVMEYSIMFEAAERTFLSEINALKRRIDRLYKVRAHKINEINAELSRVCKEIGVEGRFLDHLEHKYGNGRLTERGVETCYRLYDSGSTPIAIAHLMHISLRAARHRRKLWVNAGGVNRRQIDYNKLPRRRFYRAWDD